MKLPFDEMKICWYTQGLSGFQELGKILVFGTDIRNRITYVTNKYKNPLLDI
jgi:hypothetical protein